MKINGTLSISFPSDGSVNIRIRDDASSIVFVDMCVSHEEFSRALSTLAERPVISCDVRGLEYVGKQCITERRSIVCPLATGNRGELSEWLKENAKEEGWTVNPYLGSQRSVDRDQGVTTLNYSVTKYVEINNQEAATVASKE